MAIPSPTPTSIAALEKRAELVKTARQQVSDRIRNDWAFDPGDVSSHAPLIVNPANAAAERRSGEDALDAGLVTGHDMVGEEDVTEWRERTYASSDPSDDEEEKSSPIVRKVNGNVNGKGATNGDTNNEAKRRQARKGRRRERLEKELEWNEGLRFWEARRDAWCCARRVSLSEYTPTSTSTSLSSDSNSSSSEPSKSDSKSPHNALTLLPLAPPLLPNTDPTRAVISTSYYPSIFSKVVTQSLVPSVPINLSHMVPALVAGWKNNGDWPPRSTAVASSSPAVAQGAVAANKSGGLGLDRKISGAKERLLKKYHGRHGQRDGEAGANGGVEDAGGSPVAGSGKGVGMLKGVAKVGKVFRFSLSGVGGGDEKV